MVIPNLPNSENGRLRRDENTVLNQTQNSSKQQVPDISWPKSIPAENHKDESGAWKQLVKLRTTTMVKKANSPRFSEFCNENENLSKVCQTFCLLEQKVQQAFQTCQTCRFQNLVVNQTQIPSLPILPFSELLPIKHTLN